MHKQPQIKIYIRMIIIIIITIGMKSVSYIFGKASDKKNNKWSSK